MTHFVTSIEILCCYGDNKNFYLNLMRLYLFIKVWY